MARILVMVAKAMVLRREIGLLQAKVGNLPTRECTYLLRTFPGCFTNRADGRKINLCGGSAAIGPEQY